MENPCLTVNPGESALPGEILKAAAGQKHKITGQCSTL